MRFLRLGTAPMATVPVSPSAATPRPTAPEPGESVRIDLGETGHRVFPVMLGAAEFGWNLSQSASFDLMDRYAELGGNALHTADGFAGGRSEHIVGSWLRSRSAREGTVLGVRVGAHPDNPGLGAVNLVRAVEASLTRLRVERIDVLYLDATVDPGGSLEDTLATVEWLRESGKIGAVGAFGFAAERLVEARILASAGYPRIEVLDEPYNLLRRRPYEGDLRLVAGAQNLAVTPSSALEHGFLSGRARSKALAGEGVRGQQLRTHLNRRGNRILRALDLVAGEIGVPLAAVSMAWLLAQRTITAPIVNALTPAHVDELVLGAGVALSRAQVTDLTRASD